MNNPIAYIQAQLEQRGLKALLMNFFYVPFEGKTYFEIPTYNRLLFTEMAKLPCGVRIISENNAVESTEESKWLSAWEDFSGQMSVELCYQYDEGGNQLLPAIRGIEFIQVFLK